MTTNDAPAAHPSGVQFPATLFEPGSGAPDGGDLVVVVQRELGEATTVPAREEGWLREDLPVLLRGGAWVLPLAWEPEPPQPASGWKGRLFDEFHHLWTGIDGACTYAHGNRSGLDLDPGEEPRGYVAGLLAARATRADWWAVGDLALVLVVSRGPGAGRALTLHVVPLGWVSSRRPTRSPEVDLTWTWDDLVALHSSLHGASSGVASVQATKEKDA